jgi:FlaG/FlaF family flagellin (archaellin)
VATIKADINQNTIKLNVTQNTVKATVDKTGPQGPQGEQGTAGTNGQGVPTGGTTGQVLAKNSNTNYDTEWVDPSAGGGVSEEFVLAMATAL